MLNKYILMLFLSLIPVLSFSQISEIELTRIMDSIQLSLNPDDPDFEEKMERGKQYLITLMEKAMLANDTVNIDGIEQAESIQYDMYQSFLEEKGTYADLIEFAGFMEVIIINLKDNDSIYNIDNLDKFTRMKTLIIRGDMTQYDVDLHEVFTRIADKDIEELYVINCKGGVTSIPESITLLASLRVLGLFGNNIHEIPIYIGALTKIEVLYFDSNPISVIPDTISDLKKLSVIGLAATNVSAAELSSLTQKYPHINFLSK